MGKQGRKMFEVQQRGKKIGCNMDGSIA